MWQNLLFSSTLLLLSVLLLWAELVRPVPQVRDEANKRYLAARKKRRLLTSGLIGLCGLAIGAGTFVPPGPIGLFYWSGTLLLVLAIFAATATDLLSTRRHFLSQHQTLRHELHRLRKEQSEKP